MKGTTVILAALLLFGLASCDNPAPDDEGATTVSTADSVVVAEEAAVEEISIDSFLVQLKQLKDSLEGYHAVFPELVDTITDLSTHWFLKIKKKNGVNFACRWVNAPLPVSVPILF